MRAVIDISSTTESPISSIGTNADSVCLTSGTTPAETSASSSGITVYTSFPDRFEAIAADTILEVIAGSQGVAIEAVEVPQRLVTVLAGNSSQEIFYSAVINAITHGEEINVVDMKNTATISNADRSAILRYTLQLVNIEELCPAHPWESHQEESIAAAYHSISAYFIRLGDFEGALEVLALSDRFEDSPRSLALRGMIATMKGETLDAVANMVSSLQQYEKRKVSEADHYLKFSPESFEDINAELKDGLEALNRRDNENALVHFSQAVFQFDRFYREFGIDKLNKR